MRTVRRLQSHCGRASDAPTVPSAPLDHCPANPEPPGAASERPGGFAIALTVGPIGGALSRAGRRGRRGERREG